VLEKRLAKCGEEHLHLPSIFAFSHLIRFLLFSFGNPKGVIAVDSHNTMVKPKSQAKVIQDSALNFQDF